MESRASAGPEVGRVVVSPGDNWRALLRTRTNALISGPADALDAFVDVARAELQEPILVIPCDERIGLTPAGTVVLRNIHLLDAGAQASLVSWMDEPVNSRTQIVSVTPVPLLPGEFDRNLYYRLNTLHFTVQLA